MNRRASCFNASSSFAAAYSFTERFCAASRPWLRFHPAPHGIPLESFSLFISHPCVFLNNASTRNSGARAPPARQSVFERVRDYLPAFPPVFRRAYFVGETRSAGKRAEVPAFRSAGADRIRTGRARFPLRGREPHQNRTFSFYTQSSSLFPLNFQVLVVQLRA